MEVLSVVYFWIGFDTWTMFAMDYMCKMMELAVLFGNARQA